MAKGRGWHFRASGAVCRRVYLGVAPDCQTLVSQWVTVRTEETLLRLLKASGATPAEMDEIERDMKQQGRGSTFIEVNETGAESWVSLPPP
jgi:hypothetical protein